MREILAQLGLWMEAGEQVAIATLVRVRGTAPQRPGARLLVTASGKVAGSVSGGCVESDVIARAQSVLETGTSVVTEYGISDDAGIEVGLSCGGTIDVLIQKAEPGGVWMGLVEAVAAAEPAALALAVSPEKICGGALLCAQGEAAGGSFVGSLGAKEGPDGGRGHTVESLDVLVANTAFERLAEGAPPGVVSIERNGEAARIEGEGLEVFVQSFASRLHLVIVGATHAAIALSRLARDLDFETTVIDPRAVFANPERLPDVDTIVCEWPEEAIEKVRLDERCYVVTLSHDPKFDLPTLRRVLEMPVAYIGCMGSRRTHARRLATLGDEGFSTEQLGRIHGPVGLDLGGRAPEEIAVSIIAEILAVRYGRDVNRLGR